MGKITDVFDDAKDSIDDAVNDAGDKIQSTEDWIKCSLGGDPTFMQMIDFDRDCNRNIEIKIGDNEWAFDALWLWGIIIGLLLGFCLFGVICCRR